MTTRTGKFYDPNADADCGQPLEDLTPSAYEESIARRLGVTVEQLRREQQEADAHMDAPEAADRKSELRLAKRFVEYQGLTDLQIVICELLKSDGPAPTARLLNQAQAEQAMMGEPRPLWWKAKEVQHAVDELINKGIIRWSITDGGYTYNAHTQQQAQQGVARG